MNEVIIHRIKELLDVILAIEPSSHLHVSMISF